MAVNDGVLRLESDQSTQTSSPVYSMLPNALQSGLQPLALVRRSLSGYGYKSRRRVTSLGLFRSDSQDTLVARDEITVASSSPANNAEISGISWKFARHGKDPAPEPSSPILWLTDPRLSRPRDIACGIADFRRPKPRFLPPALP